MDKHQLLFLFTTFLKKTPAASSNAQFLCTVFPHKNCTELGLF